MISPSKLSSRWFLSNIQFIFKKLHLVFVCFLYFPSLPVTLVSYISQLKFESCHRYMTGRPERIMLPGDVNNRKSAKLLDLLGSPAESFLPASMWNIPWKLKVVFPIPIRQLFFWRKLLKTIKHETPVELTKYPRCKSWVHYKRRKEILKKKSKDKILNSSPVSIFFDKSFLVSSSNKILAIELSKSNLRDRCR